MFNISRQQVNDYVRAKGDILEKARLSRYKRSQGAKTHKSGMFSVAEAEVMKQFKASRVKGRQVGPKWIKQAMRREVRKLVDDPNASDKTKAAAKVFRAERGWLQRFCSRHKICL